MKQLQLYLLAFSFITFGFLHAQNEPPEKPLRDYPVNDYINLFSKSESQYLDEKLLGYFDTTSTQIVIVAVSSTNGMPIDEYAAWIGEKWGVGQTDAENGIVLLIAKDDRKVSIQMAYGIEQYLNAAATKAIIDNEIIPQFKKGDYFAGVDEGTDAIFVALNGKYDGTPRKPKVQKDRIFVVLIILIFFLIMIFRNRGGGPGGGRRAHYGNAFWIGGLGSGSYRGGGGGSSLGGFGGFGGGSFGGGGASGSW